MTTKYKILFAVELLHEYYSNSKCPDIAIIPSEETAVILKNKKVIWKMAGNMLIALVKVDDTDKPFTKLGTDERLIFYMELLAPRFMTISNLDLGQMKTKRFWFSNVHQNKSTVVIDGNNVDFFNLSEGISNYTSPFVYNPGDMVKHGGITYECIHKTTGGDTPATPSSVWRNKDRYQYATAKDMRSFVPRVHTYEVSSATVFSIKVFAYNTATNLYDREVLIENNLVVTDQPTTEVQTNLAGLPAGRYKLTINSNVFEVYIDDAAVYGNYLGVIELFNHWVDGTDFALLDTGGITKDKMIAGKPTWLNFSIRFANRSAFWKYFTPHHKVTAIVASEGFSFLPAAGPSDFFTSALPIPLRETPFQFDLTLAIPPPEPPVAANPDPSVPGQVIQDSTTLDYYCNIYLNY